MGVTDAVFTIPEFTLTAQGIDEQKEFIVDTSFAEDVWAQGVEIRPGNRRVVHHAHVWIEPAQKAEPVKPIASLAKLRVSYILREGTRKYVSPDAPVIDDGCAHPDGGLLPGGKLSELGSILASFVPGKAPESWPAGIAKRIPAGSRLRFTIHYSKTTGQPEKDATSVGIVFAKRPPERELRRIDLHNTAFLIPAQEDIHVVTA